MVKFGKKNMKKKAPSKTASKMEDNQKAAKKTRPQNQQRTANVQPDIKNAQASPNIASDAKDSIMQEINKAAGPDKRIQKQRQRIARVQQQKNVPATPTRRK